MTRILQDYRLSEYMEVFILLILGMVSFKKINKYQKNLLTFINFVYLPINVPLTTPHLITEHIITNFQVFQIVDGSPFSLKTRWKSVWDMEIPKEFFSVFAQNFIKTVLSLIVVARCSTTYLYVLSSLLVMACILTVSAGILQNNFFFRIK